LKLSLGLALAAISLLALVPIAQATSTTSSTSSSGQSTGYVAYSIQASVNESVTPTSSPDKSVVQVTIDGTLSNLTYSRVVNSSLTLLPYLPSISNENYTYSGKSYSATVKISQQGTSQVSFQGKSYTLSDYSFSAVITSTNGTQTITGSVSAFPSDLVYSVSAQTSNASVSATLTSTSLALSTATSGPAIQAASAGIGITLAAGAVALSLGVRMKRKQGSAGPSTPDHWVD